MAKKFLFGCLGLAVGLMLVAGLSAYFFLYRPLRATLGNLERIHQANQRIENRQAYEPPAAGELSREPVERFVAVQRYIWERLEQEISVLEEKYEELGEELQERDASLAEMMTAWSDVLQLFAEAKNIQVDALNREDFSLAEYNFVRHAFYQALGLELLPYDLDSVAEAAHRREFAFAAEDFKTEEREIAEEALAKNRDLVSEYADEARQWLLFAWWGL